VLLLLLACLTTADIPTPDGHGGGSSGGQLRPDPLPLPEATPFEARTRVGTITLVDERGEPVLVLEALGVKVSVQRLLAERAWVKCVGCRAPIDGWIQRSLLLPTTGAAPQGDLRAEDRLLVQVEQWSLTTPALDHGLVSAGRGRWKAPPWHGEGGYAGAVASVAAEGEGWSLEVAEPTPAPTPAPKPPREAPE